MSRDLTLVKLGGSLITDKTRPGTVRAERLRMLAMQLARALSAGAGALVLGHGSGSYGHVEASRHGFDRPIDDAGRWLGVARTQDRAAVLHRLVVAALLARDVPAFSWAPSSALVAGDGRPAVGETEPLVRALQAGLVPVVFGDVVMDRARGASICSTERVFEFLSTELATAGWRARRILWMGDTDGVWDAEGERIPELDARSVTALGGAIGASRGVDVTGGMGHRLEAALGLARSGVESWILDGREPEALLRALLGEPRGGTRIAGSRSAAGGDA